jgi:hypothetical protein
MSNSPMQPKSNPVTGGSITGSGLYGAVTVPYDRTLTLRTDGGSGREELTAANIRMFKEMCGLLEYIASVDPKFKEYVMAYKAKQRILR